MNEGRLCGYCRQPGHMMRKCPTVLEERQLILKHTPEQRLVTVKALAKIGLGIGAMIQRREWYEPAHIGIIDNYDWLTKANFIETRPIKYSKRVRIIPLFVNESFGYRRIHLQYVGMGNGSAGHKNLGIYISRALAAIEGRHVDGYENDYTIVAPSNTLDFDPSILVENVIMPARLCFSDEKEKVFRGIMPALATG